MKAEAHDPTQLKAPKDFQAKDHDDDNEDFKPALTDEIVVSQRVMTDLDRNYGAQQVDQWIKQVAASAKIDVIPDSISDDQIAAVAAGYIASYEQMVAGTGCTAEIMEDVFSDQELAWIRQLVVAGKRSNVRAAAEDAVKRYKAKHR